ncbi:hypothetical protein FA13DRAFT_1640691, partial [Coprinellus micaceus]
MEGQTPLLDSHRNDTFTFKHGAVMVNCAHPRTAKGPAEHLACAILTALDLWWSAELGCLISPRQKSVILSDGLKSYIQGQTCTSGVDSEEAFLHVTNHFPMESQAKLLLQWSSKEVAHPIPGLQPADKRYHCPDC